MGRSSCCDTVVKETGLKPLIHRDSECFQDPHLRIRDSLGFLGLGQGIPHLIPGSSWDRGMDSLNIGYPSIHPSLIALSLKSEIKRLDNGRVCCSCSKRIHESGQSCTCKE